MSDNSTIHINATSKEEISIWRRLIFCYTGGEKTIITVSDLDLEQIKDMAQIIAESTSDFVLLDIGTSKEDVILVNKNNFLFMMSSILTKEEVEKSLGK